MILLAFFYALLRKASQRMARRARKTGEPRKSGTATRRFRHNPWPI
jgi:hypothetical protein